ncbi:hypothetical protein L6164_024594 [Bauhinia variegata]|uniref:Uncharacterized protein n=1 Tax=Bauhinia variegata TaxID=167791 RepID=A0ACB9LY40_BAUVA|nr:hypothetical protein L6164_024594 [Bauhinia variegata]
MSCNGCRVLRKGCSETCSLRTCLQWIESPEAQGHATLFLAKFFGRSDLMSFVSSVSETKRPALFQSLLFEACGRTVNPVNGAVGLLWSGNWHVCLAALETVLSGGVLRPLPEIFGGVLTPVLNISSDTVCKNAFNIGRSVYSEFIGDMNQKLDFDLSLIPESYGNINAGRAKMTRQSDPMNSLVSGESETSSYAYGNGSCGDDQKRLLNLFN